MADQLARLMFKIVEEIHKVAKAQVAPFTRGGKLDFSTPNAVGRVPWTRVGDGTGIPPGGTVPDPFVYLVDDDGAYITDGDGAFLYEPEA